MVFTLIGSSVLALSLLIVLSFCFKWGYDDWYSAILYLLLLSTWVIPILFLTNIFNFQSFIGSTNFWIIGGTIFFLFQGVMVIPLSYLANKFNSEKQIIFFLMIFYVIILVFSSLFLNMVTLFLLIIASAILTASFPLQSLFWLKQTKLKRIYQSIWTTVSLPILGFLIAFFINSFWTLGNNFAPTILLVFLLLFAIVMTFIFWVLNVKPTKHLERAYKEKPISDYYSIKFFKNKYIWLLTLLNLVFFIFMNYYIWDMFGSLQDDIKIIIPLIICFVALIITLLVGPYLVLKFNVLIIFLTSLFLMVIPIIVGIFFGFFQYQFASLWVVLIVPFVIGYMMIEIFLLTQLFFISRNENEKNQETKYLFSFGLTIQVVGAGAGFLISNLILFNNNYQQVNILSILFLAFGGLILIFTIFLKNHKFILKNNRQAIKKEFI